MLFRSPSHRLLHTSLSFSFVPFPFCLPSVHFFPIRVTSGDSGVLLHFGLAPDSLGLVYTLWGSSRLPLSSSPTSLLFALTSPGRWHDSCTFPFHFIITCPLVPCDIRSDLWLVYCTVILHSSHATTVYTSLPSMENPYPVLFGFSLC